MNTLQERLRAVIETVTDERGRFAELEKLTSISANSWKSFWHGRQRPTCDMIEAACTHWPQYAFWISTGITDAKYGHVDHKGEASFPEKRRARRQKAEMYWQAAIEWCGLERFFAAHPEVDKYEGNQTQNLHVWLLELEIGRNAEQQALAAIEDADLVSDLVKAKTTTIFDFMDDSHDDQKE